jgi:hypothetical protein
VSYNQKIRNGLHELRVIDKCCITAIGGDEEMQRIRDMDFITCAYEVSSFCFVRWAVCPEIGSFKGHSTHETECGNA